MPFDLKNLNPPSRFFWPDDPEGKEWVEIRLVSEHDRLTLVKKVGISRKAVFKVNPNSKRMERIEFADTDMEKGEEFIAGLNDLTIVTWDLKTPDGKKIPCTKESKNALLGGSERFSLWIEKCLKTLRGSEEEQEEELEKNV